MSINLQTVTAFISSKDAGATSKDVAAHFGVNAKLINTPYSPNHVDKFESTWPGIYKLVGIESRNYIHYATIVVPKPVVVPTKAKITLKAKAKAKAIEAVVVSEAIEAVVVMPKVGSVTVIVRKYQSGFNSHSCDQLLSITQEEKARIVGETYVKGVKVSDVQDKHGIYELTRWRNEVKRGTLIPIYDNPVDPLQNRLMPPFIWGTHIPLSGPEGRRIRAMAAN